MSECIGENDPGLALILVLFLFWTMLEGIFFPI